ncbi:MAG TPA: M67 family metallopeptidase [Blastocatellia bacterium]|nr:M67 family metallopeptidase [Blastocatellia bacterium]
MSIRMRKETLEAIKLHGEETYPNECCGFLLGKVEDNSNRLEELYRAENEWPKDEPKAGKAGQSASDRQPEENQDSFVTRKLESQRNRYLITAEQWRQADGYARAKGLGIIGYYHSHPDHPAAPSGYDLDHSCWPGESYIIVAVEKGKAEAVNSYTKPDYTKFEQEEIIVET